MEVLRRTHSRAWLRSEPLRPQRQFQEKYDASSPRANRVSMGGSHDGSCSDLADCPIGQTCARNFGPVGPGITTGDVSASLVSSLTAATPCRRSHDG
jgi:hypothetical protein